MNAQLLSAMKSTNAVVANAMAARVAKNAMPTFGEIKSMRAKYNALMKQGEQAKRVVDSLNNSVAIYAREAKELLANVKKWVADDYMDDDDLYAAKDYAAEADRLTTAMKYAFPALRDNF